VEFISLLEGYVSGVALFSIICGLSESMNDGVCIALGDWEGVRKHISIIFGIITKLFCS
jgi:hypothetical protein